MRATWWRAAHAAPASTLPQVATPAMTAMRLVNSTGAPSALVDSARAWTALARVIGTSALG